MKKVPGACTIKHYGLAMYGLRCKPRVFVSEPVKVIANMKDTSLLFNLSIFCTSTNLGPYSQHAFFFVTYKLDQ
jgi:hypothetical protein